MLYQTHVKVHLSNIAHNIQNIRKAIGDKTKMLIAVKANAYGHGAIEVSRMAEKLGVDYLGVATIPEGIELRQAGIKLPILKLNHTFTEELEEAGVHNISLSICSRDNIDQLNQIAQKLSKFIEVHLKVDTGMGRIGVSPEEVEPITEYIIDNCKFLKLSGIMTHLPVSDEASKSFTERQLKLFTKTVTTTEQNLSFKFPLVHCANSGAVLGHPDSWLDMVRPGIMIYGFYPSNEVPRTIELKPGLSFFSKLSLVKKVTKGTPISYGRTWVASKDTWIGTFPAGYADGFNRLFSNSGRVLINGKSYPVVGRVCMDQSMCDLGEETDVKIGDTVTLIGNSGTQSITAYEWAEKLKTITYEVTSQINHRVERYYEPY